MDPSNQIQKLGQQEYRRKNYHAALNFFNSVRFQMDGVDVGEHMLKQSGHRDGEATRRFRS